jgi:NTE family protein
MKVLVLVLLLLPAPFVQAADDPAAVQHPKIGLVLGGGGARGAAHAGVLKVLEELHVPVDYVVGTSMGSIVGGLYASGMSPEQIEREIRAMDWDDLFKDEPARADRSFRRKSDDYTYAAKAKAGFNGGKLQVPLAYIRGQKFDLAINRLILNVIDVKDFDRLPIPYRAVAADLGTGKEVVLAKGSLPLSIRASMAVPAVFDPVEIDGKLLVDGGIADNVPVSVARAMGADVVIVVDVGEGLADSKDIKDALDVSGQLANILFTLNTEKQLKSLTSRDVLIRPALGDIGGGGFDRAAEAIPDGEAAARAAAGALRRYSLSPEQYARHVAQRGQRNLEPPVIDFIRIDNQSRVGDDVISKRITARTGKPLDVKQLEEDIGQIYGLEIFESVRYDLVRENGKTGLVITAKEKGWGPGYLQFGLASSNDFKGNSTIRFGLLYTLTEINALNGEWRVGAQLGDEPGIYTEIHQPLDPLSRYFAAGRVGYTQNNMNVFDSAGNILSRYQLVQPYLELSTGREFGTWGEGRIGYLRSGGEAKIIIGAPSPNITLDRGELFVRLSDDKLDNVNFPRYGHFARAEYVADRKSLGASNDFDQMGAIYSHAYSWESNAVFGSLFGAVTKDDNAPLESLYRLGGFLRLSGLQESELSGQDAGFMTLVYMRRLANSRLLGAYAGASIEAGNVWQNRKDITFDNSIIAGSAFLGFDTPIGPLYLAYGHTNTSRNSLYIYLGPRFEFTK